MFSRVWIVLIALILSLFAVGCERWNTEYAGVKKPKESPYKLQLDPHSTSNREAKAP
jgi:hypothetical protein